MCGIVGYISKEEQIDVALFEKMTDILIHRGPDDRGTYYESLVALGQRRLSILDLSADGHQPMHYLQRYTIVFNGEIFNYIELREELSRAGYSFVSKTDTEVLMAAYDYWGAECLNKLNGMWAFALYDRAEGQLFAARDRFGVKPFYYYLSGDRLVWASEIKALLPALPGRPKANIPRLLDNILLGAFDHTSETMFEGVRQLQPGCYLRFDVPAFSLAVTRYYDIDRITPNQRSYPENTRRFKELFIDAVRLRLRSDVPVGSCLSGGLDSSSIVCVAAGLLKNKPGDAGHHTISSCYKQADELKYDEQEYIDQVVAQTGVQGHKIYPDVTDFFANLDHIIYHQDEPVGGLCHEAQYNVFKAAAREGITVMLDGQGADEQLAGYTPFYSVLIREYLRRFHFAGAWRELNAFRKEHKDTEVYGMKGLIWFMVSDLLPAWLRKRALKYVTSREEFEWLKVPYDETTVQQTRKYTSFDDYTKKQMKYGLINLLHFEDRNAMASSIEGRVPFLDYRLVEHVLSLPPDQKLKAGVTKRILRDAMRGIIPEGIRTRTTKLGFAVPVDVWVMKHPGKVREELADALEALTDILDKEKILRWFDQNKTNELALKNVILWRIICAGKWVKRFQVTFR